MAYILGQASDHMAIAEREWAKDQEIRFTHFSSCIGIVARTSGDKLIGIHLAQFDAGNNPITEDDVQRVAEILQDNGAIEDKICMVGEIGYWPFEGTTLAKICKACQQLLSRLNIPSTRQSDKGSGIYGAKIEGGELKIFKKDAAAAPEIQIWSEP